MDANDYFKQGVIFKQQGEKEKALQNYNMAIRLNPNFADVYYNRGVLFDQQGEKEKALQDYNIAIKLNLNYADVYNNRGILLKQKGEKEKALQDYNKAIQLNPNDADVYYNRGVLFNEQGEKQKALQDYNMAIKLNPNYGTAYYNRGILFKGQGEDNKALQDYNTAIKLNPNDADIYNNRGVLLDQKGEKKKALQDYNQAIKLNPNYANAYYNRGILFKQQGEKERALLDYNMAIKLNPNYAPLYYNRGILFEEQEEKQKALQDYNMAIKLNPYDADFYNNRGILFKGQEEYQLALQDYNTAIQLKPNYADFYNNRGVLYNGLGDKQKALQDYNMAIKLNPNYAPAYYNRGILFEEQGEKEKALQEFNKALILQPDDPLYLTNLGSYHLKKQQFNEANGFFTQAKKSLDSINNQQIQKWNLSNTNLQYIREQLNLLKETQLQIQTTNHQIEYLSKGLPKQKTNQLKEQAQIIVNLVILEIKPINIYINQNLQKNQFYINKQLYEQKFNDLQNQIIRLSNENSDMKIQINSILEKDYFQVSEALKQLNKKENINQFMYCNALVWRLYNYLFSMQQISSNLFSINKNAIIESNAQLCEQIFQKVVNAGLSTLRALPVCGNAFNLINTALNYGFEYRKEKKFTERLKKLNNILKCSSMLPGQLLIEIQIASLELSKTQLSNLTVQSESNLQTFIKQFLAEEDKQFKDNEYWAAGTKDALIILHYMEDNSERIVNEILNKKVLLRQIIIQAISEKNALSQNIYQQQQLGTENDNKSKIAKQLNFYK